VEALPFPLPFYSRRCKTYDASFPFWPLSSPSFFFFSVERAGDSSLALPPSFAIPVGRRGFLKLIEERTRFLLSSRDSIRKERTLGIFFFFPSPSDGLESPIPSPPFEVRRLACFFSFFFPFPPRPPSPTHNRGFGPPLHNTRSKKGREGLVFFSRLPASSHCRWLMDGTLLPSGRKPFGPPPPFTL